jgi:hypothetical protein
MIEVDKLGINTNMFAGTLSRESQAQMNALLTRFTGEPGAELMSGIREGRFTPYNVPEELLGRTNNFFNNAVLETFNLPSGLHMTRFWAGQEANANQVHLTVVKNFPTIARLLELNSELTTVTGDISDTLGVIAGHPGTKYAFEMRRRMLLAMTSTAIEADNMQIDIPRELRKIEGVMQQHVFEVPGGETYPYILYAEHDKQTNYVTATDVSGIMPDKDGVVTKRHTFNTRSVPRYGRVYYAARGKGPESSITKALDRAYKNGGKINPSEDVRDRYGLVMVGLENDEPKHLVKLVGEALNDHFKPIDPEKTREDNKTNGDYQGAVEMARTLYVFEGQGHDIPFEVMAFRPGDYIDSLLGIGTKKKNGEYSGFGRPLFEIVRLKASLDLGYPRVDNGGFYRFDMQKAVNQRQEELVPGMRKEGLMRIVT